MANEGPIFGKNFLGIYRRNMKPTVTFNNNPPPPNNGFQFVAFGATNNADNNINDVD